MFEQNLFDYLKAHAPSIAALTSAAATALGAVASFAAKAVSSRADQKRTELMLKRSKGSDKPQVLEGQYIESPTTTKSSTGLIEVSKPQSAREKSSLARKRIDDRIQDATEELETQLSRERRSKFASSTLIVGQYILGAVIASSFVQQHLDPTLIGSLGVLVLVASGVKDRFHPEIDAEDAKRKATQYENLIETTKDALVPLDTAINDGVDQSDKMTALMNNMTARMTQIENSEVSKPDTPNDQKMLQG